MLRMTRTSFSVDIVMMCHPILGIVATPVALEVEMTTVTITEPEDALHAHELAVLCSELGLGWAADHLLQLAMEMQLREMQAIMAGGGGLEAFFEHVLESFRAADRRAMDDPRNFDFGGSHLHGRSGYPDLADFEYPDFHDDDFGDDPWGHESGHSADPFGHVGSFRSDRLGRQSFGRDFGNTGSFRPDRLEYRPRR